MPLFDYICEEHGAFEKLIYHKDSYEQKCPKCGSVCHKVISQTAKMTTNWGFWKKNVPKCFSPKNKRSDTG